MFLGDADTGRLSAAAAGCKQVLSWGGDTVAVEIFSIPAPTALIIL